MNSDDVMRIVTDTVSGVQAVAPVHVEDNRYETRLAQCGGDPLQVETVPWETPPEYHVFVVVDGPSWVFPWVQVTHTGRYGFTPGMDEYTYLTPPVGLDRDDTEALTGWLTEALEAAVREHAPAAVRAREGQSSVAVPVEAWDAIRRIG